MNRTIIFSHESDIDGLGSVILAKLAFKNIDYVLTSDYKKLELVFREYIESKKLDNYNRIFITDLALTDPSLSIVYNSNLKEKVLVFDHHQMAIDSNLNRYSFTKIIEKDEQEKKCATKLFYEYLTNNRYLTKTNIIDEFVELTRIEDVWEWKQMGNFGQMAHDLAILYSVLGNDEYIKRVVLKLLNKSDSFYYDNEELRFIQNKKIEYNNILIRIISDIEYFVDEYNNKFGVVYANYEYRNEITEYVIKRGNPEKIKYIVIVALDKGNYGQKSYRRIVDDFDVNEIAMKHGGGGHPGASSVSITKEQHDKSLLLTKREGLKYLVESSNY